MTFLTRWAPKVKDKPGLRRSELVLVVYYLYATVVALVISAPAEVKLKALVVNLAIVAAYGLMARTEWVRSSLLVSMARDWAPFGLTVLAYRQMGWWAPEQHTFELERSWIVWDRLLLDDWGARAAIESLGALLPALLELSYALVYPMGPAAMLVLTIIGYRRRADGYLLFFLLGSLTSYAMFPFFPSEPPRTVFMGQDMPNIDTVFRQFNWWLLGRSGIHTSVFPSAHVSAGFAAAYGLLHMLPNSPWLGRVYLFQAICIFWATIYGRYHYAVDAVAGVGVAVFAVVAARYIERRYAVRGEEGAEVAVPVGAPPLPSPAVATSSEVPEEG